MNRHKLNSSTCTFEDLVLVDKRLRVRVYAVRSSNLKVPQSRFGNLILAFCQLSVAVLIEFYYII